MHLNVPLEFTLFTVLLCRQFPIRGRWVAVANGAGWSQGPN